ncbi:MAG: LCP family protein [Acidimicrobiia bacterium]
MTSLTSARTRRRTLVTVVLAPIACGLLVAGTLAAAWVAIGSPTPASGAVWFQVSKLAGAQYTGAPDQPFFALVIGTGARSDDPNEAHDDPGLADAIHVIGINPSLGSATILDIPRDTEGPTGAKLNSYIVGSDKNFGLRAEADAVSAVTGLPISYVIRANFPNFVQMVDEIGGIDVEIPYDMADENSGAFFTAGPNHLTGDQALALSRNRYTLPRGDLDRTVNQGLVLLSALKTLQAKQPGAGDTIRLVATAGRHVKLDGLGVRDLLALGQLALSVDANNVKNVLLPVANSGNGSNLAKTADAESLLADMADDGVLQSH